MDKEIIERYRSDEHMMVQLFVQWCVNNDKDPFALYELAYPSQPKNLEMEQIFKETEKNDLHITVETLLHVLQLFGNDDLAFIVFEQANRQ